jgi:hypothetical protein
MNTETHPPLRIKESRELKPIRELCVRDLWHLASAVAKTGECLAKARSTEIVSASQAEEVLESLLADSPLHDGENARAAILEVWHRANATTRALLLLETRLHRILEGAVAMPDIVGRARLVQLVHEALEGGEA